MRELTGTPVSPPGHAPQKVCSARHLLQGLTQQGAPLKSCQQSTPDRKSTQHGRVSGGAAVTGFPVQFCLCMDCAVLSRYLYHGNSRGESPCRGSTLIPYPTSHPLPSVPSRAQTSSLLNMWWCDYPRACIYAFCIAGYDGIPKLTPMAESFSLVSVKFGFWGS